MTRTNRDKSTLSNSSSKAVMVLHLLVHTESDRNSGVKMILSVLIKNACSKLKCATEQSNKSEVWLL